LRCASHSNLKNISDLSKCQVGIFFQWVDYVKQAAPEGKTILWVNCDETSIGYAFPRLRGNVVRGFRKRAATEKGIQKNEMRGSITYLTFSCDRGEVQSLLPQILLGNKRCFTPALLQAVREHMPPNVHVMRENSSWVSSAVMMRCLELLSHALQSVSAQLQIVVLLDTARAHLGLEVARRAAELHIWLIIISAGLTWLLQPLDVCIFASFKR